jgi:acetyl esterase/lipase
MNVKFFAMYAAWLLLTGVAFAAETKPTHVDVRYSDKYNRSVLDFWKVEGDKPAPLVVYFHGGAFRAGDKAGFRRDAMLAQYHPQGVAFASVNYPFTGDANLIEILRHTEEAIALLESKAGEWNIDAKRIAVRGISAGAVISEYLAYWTRRPISACLAEEQPYHSELLLAGMKGGGPPLLLYTYSGPNDEVHHPKYARLFKEHCDKVGIACELFGSEASGLPVLPGKKPAPQAAMEFLHRAWKLPMPGATKRAALGGGPKVRLS